MNEQPITKGTLAIAYGISPDQLRLWLHKCGFYSKFPEAKTSKILTPKQVNYIYSKLDPPKNHENPENHT